MRYEAETQDREKGSECEEVFESYHIHGIGILQYCLSVKGQVGGTRLVEGQACGGRCSLDVCTKRELDQYGRMALVHQPSHNHGRIVNKSKEDESGILVVKQSAIYCILRPREFPF